MMEDYKKLIITNGVRSLQKFGYPDADDKNIFTNKVYKAFFKNQVQTNLRAKNDPVIKEAFESVLKDLENGVK